MKIVYAILCVIGALLPLSQFVPWLIANGLAVPLLIQQAFGSPISSFAWLDVLVSAVVLLVFICVEGTRTGMANLWLPIVALVAVGVSLSFPLFLLMRERHLDRGLSSVGQP